MNNINNPMNVAILSAATAPLYYELLDNKLNTLIESSQCFLFNILCGFVEGRSNLQESLGETWAKRHGAPILYITEKTTDKLLHKLFLKADYIIFILDGNPFINKAFMQYKMLGKHGSVIKIEKKG